MGREIVYCISCGERLLERDFGKGRAETIQRKNYCSRCMVEVVKAKAQEEKKEALSDVAAPRIVRARTQRIPLAEPPSGFKIPLHYLLAIGVAIVAVILLALVLSRGNR